MFFARHGLPLGIMVTVSLPQFAIQMLPLRSDMVACGHQIWPSVTVKPFGPEMGFPFG